MLGRAVETDAVAHLRAAGLVGPGPRSPRPGAPLTFVTTDAFLDAFGLESLADLPGLEDLRAIGLVGTDVLDGTPAGTPAPPEFPPRPSLPPAPFRTPTGPPATDLTSRLADVAAISARVGARLRALTPDGDEVTPTDQDPPADEGRR